MDAKAHSVGFVLSQRQRFEVPVYQRTYEWTKEGQLERLFGQIADKAEERLENGQGAAAHFMGALIVQSSKFVHHRVPTLVVVDGQQRLTTFQLFLAAIAEAARRRKTEDVERQAMSFLLNSDLAGLSDPERDRFKLQPTGFDRDLFRMLIDRPHDAEAAGPNHNMVAAHRYFLTEIERFIEDTDEAEARPTRLRTLFATLLEDFKLVVITLEETDDAQVIFETLNAGGKPLSAMDLVRNDLYYRALSEDGLEAAEALLTQRWTLFEHGFWKQDATQGRVTKPRMDFFLWNVLSAETGRDVSLSELYSDYRRLTAGKSAKQTFDMLARHAPTYQMLAMPSGDSALARIARQLNDWDVRTAYPLVLLTAADLSIDEAGRDAIYQLIYAYVVRRAICQTWGKNYNNLFIRATQALRQGGVSAEALAEFFLQQTKKTNLFPDDAALRDAILTKPQYGYIKSSRLSGLLGELEMASRDKFDEPQPLPPGLHVEHVLPDAWRAHWPLPDGSRAPLNLQQPIPETLQEAIRRRDAAKNLLGNLTLLTPAANSSASNAAFNDGTDSCKQARLSRSLLKLNREIAAQEGWSEEHIAQRGRRLADLAVRIWPAPRPMAKATTAA